MERLNKFYYCILVLAILFTLWGFTQWLQAQIFIPPTPLSTGVNHYSFQKPVSAWPLSRYASLQNGALFFGPDLQPTPTQKPKITVAAQPPSKAVFSSKLLLYGVSKGADAKIDRAIVGLIADPAQQTWIVQPGSVVNGETVVKIEAKAIWAKNATGQGRIELRQ